MAPNDKAESSVQLKLALSSEMLTLPGAAGPHFESQVMAGMRVIRAHWEEGGHYQLICKPNKQVGIVGHFWSLGMKQNQTKQTFSKICHEKVN